MGMATSTRPPFYPVERRSLSNLDVELCFIYLFSDDLKSPHGHTLRFQRPRALQRCFNLVWRPQPLWVIEKIPLFLTLASWAFSFTRDSYEMNRERSRVTRLLAQ